MRARQPVAQQLRCLGRCGAVKRHQRSGHAGQPHDVSAPTVVRDWRDFDEIRASCDGFLKAMYVSGHVVRRSLLVVGNARNCTYVTVANKRSAVRKRSHTVL